MIKLFTAASQLADAMHRMAACPLNGLNNRNGNNNRLTGRAIA